MTIASRSAVRRSLALLLAAAFALSGAPFAAGQDTATRPQDNAAVAINTKDGSTVFKLAFDIRRELGAVVDNQNAAVAYSSCEGCKTVAIAIQIVLVMGDPEVVTPENVAIAINDMCTSCETIAAAYQFVFGTDGLVRLSKEGRKRLHDLVKSLRELKDADMTPEQLVDELNRITSEVQDVFATELVPVRKDEKGDDRDDEAQNQDEPSPTPSPTASVAESPTAAPPEATASPPPAPATASPTATPSETPTTEPTATPSAAGTPEPTP